VANGTGAFRDRVLRRFSMAGKFRQRAIAAGLVQGEQVFEKVVPARTRPRFLVPVGTPCAVRNIAGGDEVPFTTTRDVGFERFERWVKDGGANIYEFREGGWLLLVQARYVISRLWRR
jgi:hypothetical protein